MDNISLSRLENWERLKFDLGEAILFYLQDDSVVEIMVNPDSKMWIEKHDGVLENIGKISPDKTMMIINTVAYSLNTIVDTNKPDISAEFPIDGSRFQGAIPPIVEAPSFSIRKKAIQIFTLKDYVESNTLTTSQRNIISQICKSRKNILIVGATASGKTTFANAIIKEISEVDPDCRMGIIEDTKELQCDIKNKIDLKTCDKRDMNDLLKIMMRFRPNRICVGEVRGFEAYALLMAWNSGHGGGIATVHANNARAGIKKIEQILTAHNINPVPAIIAEAINYIISIQKTDKGRKINEIVEISHEGKEYVFKDIN